MRKTLLIALLFMYQIAVPQDYQCIKSDTDYFFTDGMNYKAVSVDSVVLTGDSLIYYNYPTMGIGEPEWCFSQDGPSWIGNIVIEKPIGESLFYNRVNESILIRTGAINGESWYCFEFISGNSIRATVESTQEMMFLGITDSVKIISFQVLDTLLNPISHQVNNMNLFLSQHWGLIKTINFNIFPDYYDYLHNDYCHEFELCGINSLETGTTNLTATHIFDFAIGDNIHTHQYTYTWTGSNIYHNSIKLINQIINKQIVRGELHYTIQRCGRRDYSVGVPPDLWDTVYFFNDTIFEAYNLENISGYGDLNMLPDQIITLGDSIYHEYHWYTQTVNDEIYRLEKTKIDGFVSGYPHDCIQEIITDDKFHENYYYVEGLGGPYWNYGEWGNQYFKQIVYYKKGDEEWGEPFICDSLLVNLYEYNNPEFRACVAPNPMHYETKITIYNPAKSWHRLRLFDSFGRQMSEWTFSSELILRKENLSSGVYYYSIDNGTKFNLHGKLIIL